MRKIKTLCTGTIGMLVVVIALLFCNTGYKISLADSPVIPEPGGYTMENTVLGGDFECFNVGQSFGTSSSETNFWGTNIAYDYPAVVTADNENKILKLAKGDGVKPYASAFVFISNEFSNGDFMTVEFDYKLSVASLDPYTKENLAKEDKVINFSFAPATGEEHHTITLDGTNPIVTGGANQFKWAVRYSDSANGEGWNKVTLDLSVNPGTLVANSLRWLMPITATSAPDDAMFLDNVKIIRWIDNNVKDLRPVLVSGDKSTFDKNNAKDVSIVINTKGEELNNIKRGATNVNATAFTKKTDGENVTVVLKSKYLATLENGKHTFTCNTIEGSVTFELDIVEEKKGGCGSNIVNNGVGVMASIGLFGMLLFIILKKTKHATK